MNRIPLPPDERLELLIRDAFEAMPGPQMQRLEMIESRVMRAARPAQNRGLNTLPWWIVLLLAGGFAVAAWRAGELRVRDQATDGPRQTFSEQQVPDEETGVDVPTETTGPGAPSGSIDTDDDSPVIYQREAL